MHTNIPSHFACYLKNSNNVSENIFFGSPTIRFRCNYKEGALVATCLISAGEDTQGRVSAAQKINTEAGSFSDAIEPKPGHVYSEVSPTVPNGTYSSKVCIGLQQNVTEYLVLLLLCKRIVL